MSQNPPPLTGLLGLRYPNKSRGCKLHDVGDGRWMTARQIAAEARCDVSLIHSRIHAGKTGAELLKPRRVKLFDCGGELLTVAQIRQRTGLGEAAVYSRIARGVTGKALLRKERRDLAAPRSSTMVVACRLADAYPDRLPTTAEIRKLYPMCAQSAERWLAALRAAREKAA